MPGLIRFDELAAPHRGYGKQSLSRDTRLTRAVHQLELALPQIQNRNIGFATDL